MMDTLEDAVSRRRSNALSALLGATDVAPRAIAFPAARVARAAGHAVLVRRLRLAAAVTLMIAGLGVPPVRAWIAGSFRAIWSRVAGPPASGIVTTDAPAPLPDRAVGSVTLPAGDVVVLRIGSRQASGTLTILTTDGLSASATVMGQRDAAELVVLPDGLRIVNPVTATADYELRVPATVGRVVVQIGREAPRVFHPATTGQQWTLDLRARRNVR